MRRVGPTSLTLQPLRQFSREQNISQLAPPIGARRGVALLQIDVFEVHPPIPPCVRERRQVNNPCGGGALGGVLGGANNTWQEKEGEEVVAEMIGGELELVTVLGQLSGAHHDPWGEKKAIENYSEVQVNIYK